jgi:hypothetical protein
MNRISDTNVLILARTNGERYVFHYRDDNRQECLRTLGKFASNPDLSFSWRDAAQLSERMRQQTLESKRTA